MLNIFVCQYLAFLNNSTSFLWSYAKNKFSLSNMVCDESMIPSGKQLKNWLQDTNVVLAYLDVPAPPWMIHQRKGKKWLQIHNHEKESSLNA